MYMYVHIYICIYILQPEPEQRTTQETPQRKKREEIK